MATAPKPSAVATSEADTLADAFKGYVRQAPDALALRCRDLEGRQQHWTRATLASNVRGYAQGLAARGVSKGERVVLALETSVEFVALFWAIQALGAVATPIAAASGRGRLASLDQHLARVCEIAKPALVISERADIVAGRSLCAPKDLVRPDPGGWPNLNLGPDDNAVLQFTSGSTGRPRGCTLTQTAILANARAIIVRVDVRPGDTAVSWLPLFHDMGLMTGVTLPVVAGVDAVLRSPSRFVANPLSWLEDLSAGRRTHTAAPNFALALTLQRLERRPPGALDLRGLATLVCGSEPLDADLAERFLAALEPYGLSRSAFHPAYGMAEATLMVTSRPGGLATGRDRDGQVFVNLGAPIPGVTLRICENVAGCDPAVELGEVHVRSPSLMTGYFDDPAASEETLRDGWLATGDLGFLQGEELFVVGRRKELIIVAGRNIYPTDIEHAVAHATGLLPTRVVAFGGRAHLGTETISIVMETRAGADRTALINAARAACYEACHLFPHDVLCVETGRIPRTTSGKIRRVDLKAELLADLAEA